MQSPCSPTETLQRLGCRGRRGSRYVVALARSKHLVPVQRADNLHRGTLTPGALALCRLRWLRQLACAETCRLQAAVEANEKTRYPIQRNSNQNAYRR